jgi:hypothetical protein
MLNKPKRIKNRKLLNSFHNKPCIVCGKVPSDPDHLRTRGAGGGDEESNIIPLCRHPHHIERHTIGLKSFVKKYNLPISWDTGWPKRVDV